MVWGLAWHDHLVRFFVKIWYFSNQVSFKRNDLRQNIPLGGGCGRGYDLRPSCIFFFSAGIFRITSLLTNLLTSAAMRASNQVASRVIGLLGFVIAAKEATAPRIFHQPRSFELRSIKSNRQRHLLSESSLLAWCLRYR